MIDEKKIEEAAIKHMNAVYNDEYFPVKISEIKEQCEFDFKAGAHWAIQEFLKDLWHDAEEMPPRYDDYLVKTKQGCIDSCLFSNGVWFQPKIGGGEIAMWLDYKDILPKQKGGSDD